VIDELGWLRDREIGVEQPEIDGHHLGAAGSGVEKARPLIDRLHGPDPWPDALPNGIRRRTDDDLGTEAPARPGDPASDVCGDVLVGQRSWREPRSERQPRLDPVDADPSAAWLSVASKRSSVTSSAPARSRIAADPSAHRDSPPAKRRWLLRAPRASADSRPVSRPNSVTIRFDSP